MKKIKSNMINSINNIFNSLYKIDSIKSLLTISLETKNFLIVPYAKFHKKNAKALKQIKTINKNFQEMKSKNSLSMIVYDKNFEIIGSFLISILDKESMSITKFKIKEKNDKVEELLIEIYEWLTFRMSSKRIFLDQKILKDNQSYFHEESVEDFKNIVQIIPNQSRDIPKKRILTAGPLVTNFEKLYVQDAVENGWNENSSKYIEEFENTFKNIVNSKYAIATSSCTGSIYLSLIASGIGPGDEVIVPEITWVATASAVKYTGANPIFADIDKETWTIDPESIKEVYTKNTKAIIPVHLYGNSSKMDQIMSFAKNKNLKVIEDAAPAIGATYSDRKLGSFGDYGCFSFQGAKLVVTGEGGMIVTNSKKNYEKLIKLNDHGRVPGTFWIDELGYKFKMSNLQASFGLGQLQNLEQMIDSKRGIYSRYKENLEQLKNISFIQETNNSKSIFWMTSITVNQNHSNKSSNELMEFLNQKNIDTRPVFPPISQYPIWDKKYEPKKNAKYIGENSINLPSGVTLKDSQIDYVSDQIIKFFNNE